jgi:hypothetical protein
LKQTAFPPQPRRRMPAMTDAREYRLRRGVPLVTAAVFADLPLARASEIERDPARARDGELERLKAAVDKVSAEYGDASGTDSGLKVS